MDSAPAKLRAIFCNECYRPWGVVLPRNYTTADAEEGRAQLLDAYRQWCEEAWADDVTDAVPCPPMTPPAPTETMVIYVRTKDLEWLEERGHYIDGWPEGDACWMEVEWMGVPAWFAGRRQRTAIRWDCCELPDPRTTPKAEKIDDRHGMVAL